MYIELSVHRARCTNPSLHYPQAPRAASDTANLKQLASLEEWSASLKAKMLVGVRADRREQALEGLYWLAVLKGKPFRATAATVNSGNIIEEGWLVVKARRVCISVSVSMSNVTLIHPQ